MDDNKKRIWTNLATERIDLRYPKIDLGVRPAMGTGNGYQGSVMMQTFVHNKDKTRIALVKNHHSFGPETDVFELLDKFKKVFVERCEITIDKHIFNEDYSVYEPYFLNKN